MIALSIRQPWATFIVSGAAPGLFKDVENREWHTPFRGRCLIHASKSATKRDFESAVESVESAFGIRIDTPFDAFPRGGVIGSIEIYDCVGAWRSNWFTGPYGFLLRDPRELPFREFKGRLGFFNVPELTP